MQDSKAEQNRIKYIRWYFVVTHIQYTANLLFYRTKEMGGRRLETKYGICYLWIYLLGRCPVCYLCASVWKNVPRNSEIRRQAFPWKDQRYQGNGPDHGSGIPRPSCSPSVDVLPSVSSSCTSFAKYRCYRLHHLFGKLNTLFITTDDSNSYKNENGPTK